MTGKAYKFYKALGGTANPFDAFLLINGMKTLEVRMDRHCENAMEAARFLITHSAVAKVNYNGLPDHPDHTVAMKQNETSRRHDEL